jgi:hypothetical protein
MNLTSKTSLLVLLASFDPRLWEIVHPNVPIISQGTRHIMASMVIKSISREIKDENVVKELQHTGKRLFNAGVQAMSYEDDNWCGISYKHHFGPSPQPWSFIFDGSEVMLNPQPLPPHEDAYYGAILTMLAKAVSHKEAAEVLHNIGSSLMNRSSKGLSENDISTISTFSNSENLH